MYKLGRTSLLTVNELHTYWKRPWDVSNLPEGYLYGKERSQFLVELLKKYADSQSVILEIGCNVGRNLNYLFLAGFKKLVAVEISKEAIKQLKQSFPELAKYAKIYNMPVEEIITKFEDGAFDIVFTMAVLEHIHPDSGFIFSEMARITKRFLVTIEDEQGVSWRHFPRNYAKVFESLGLEQIENFNCRKVLGLGGDFFARVFKKV
jgi:SAM-dependent methyltransferase